MRSASAMTFTPGIFRPKRMPSAPRPMRAEVSIFHDVPLLFQLFSKFRLCAGLCRPRARCLLVDALPCQLGVGAGQGLPDAVRCLYRHITADLGPFGQLFAAVHLLFDAHNAVTLHSFHLLPCF